MQAVTTAQALRQKLAPKRQRPYAYKPGAFTLTASFRDKEITEQQIAMVATLTKSFTQAGVASILGVGVSIVSKCVRIIAARNGTA